MMHKNRNKPVYLFSSSPSNRGEELKRRTKRANQRTVTFFLVFLYLFTLISFIIPLRPTYSDLEQRNLTKKGRLNLRRPFCMFHQNLPEKEGDIFAAGQSLRAAQSAGAPESISRP